MARSFGRLAFWTPRILTLGFAAFLALFALDVVGGGLGVWQTIGVIAMHLVPTAIVLAVLAVAWRRDAIGAIAYSAFAIVYLVMAAGRVHWSAILVISGSLALLGALFFIGWLARPRDGISPAR